MVDPSQEKRPKIEKIEICERVPGFFHLSHALISFCRTHSPAHSPPFPRHAPEAPLCSRWHARLPLPPAPSPPSARPRPWCAQHPAHSPTRLCDASKKFQALQPAPGGFPTSSRWLSCTETPASVARVRAMNSRGRSFLGLSLDACLGFPFPKKTTLQKLSGKGLIWLRV